MYKNDRSIVITEDPLFKIHLLVVSEKFLRWDSLKVSPMENIDCISRVSTRERNVRKLANLTKFRIKRGKSRYITYYTYVL